MSDLAKAVRQICEEKSLDIKEVIKTIESALAAAFRKDFGEKNQNIEVEFDLDTGNSKVFDIKTVVEDIVEEEDKEEVEEENNKEKINKVKKNKEKKDLKISEEEEEKKFNPKTDIQISEAKKIKKTYKIGDTIKTKLSVPANYGRMAAQTAKQVIIQRLREAERDNIFEEFKQKEKEVVSGVVQRREGRFVLIDLGKTVGILSKEEQIPGEIYNPGGRIKVYIKEVRMGAKGPEVILSRTSEEILKKIFLLEIPELANNLIELKSVAREAGSRSKVAIWTGSENIDPIGACVGQRGARIQTIIQELGGEKVDIIEYDEDPAKFITNALSPAKIISIDIKEKEHIATIKVSSDQFSLAIGKHGQNARLAARLTGWKIDIVEDKKSKSIKEENKEEKTDKKNSKKENKIEKKDDDKKVEKNKEEQSRIDASLDETKKKDDEKKSTKSDKENKDVKKDKENINKDSKEKENKTDKK